MTFGIDEDEFRDACEAFGGKFNRERTYDRDSISCTVGERRLWIQSNGWAKTRDTDGSLHSMGSIKNPSEVEYVDDLLGVDRLKVSNDVGDSVLLLREL